MHSKLMIVDHRFNGIGSSNIADPPSAMTAKAIWRWNYVRSSMVIGLNREKNRTWPVSPDTSIIAVGIKQSLSHNRKATLARTNRPLFGNPTASS